ncbi:MAG: OmpA family protein [Candidatus Melainabacteria bacterium]|nr:OmpA family protein [Candidatus Melainabacteria bacterium]
MKATRLTLFVNLVLVTLFWQVAAQPLAAQPMTPSPALAPSIAPEPAPAVAPPVAPAQTPQTPQSVSPSPTSLPEAAATTPSVTPAKKQKDLTGKLTMFKDLRIVFPILQGVDTRWQQIGDYSFVADVEFNNASGYSFRWHMTPPSRGEGTRATEIHDVNTSRRVSLFYPEHQNCTLVGYTNILRVSDAVYNSLKRGEISDFELDGPDSPLKYNREVFPLAHTIRPINIEPADIFINDHLVSVRTIHAETDNHWQYWILDNANFPLMVRGQGPFLWNLVQLRHPKLDGLLKDDSVDPDSEARRIIKSLEDTGVATTRAILFDFDKSVIRPVSKPILNKLAVYLEQHKNLRLGVEGHTDSMGGMAYNIKLSGRRANAVKSYLVNIGVAAGRLKPSGFGYTKPVADNSTAMGRQLNRRVVFRKL